MNSLGDLSYWTQKTVPEELRDVGFRTIKAFGAKSRFFHCEFFRLNEDKEGLGQKGDYVALEVNMRPAGGYTPDLINYANSVDCYQIWATWYAMTSSATKSWTCPTTIVYTQPPRLPHLQAQP